MFCEQMSRMGGGAGRTLIKWIQQNHCKAKIALQGAVYLRAKSKLLEIQTLHKNADVRENVYHY